MTLGFGFWRDDRFDFIIVLSSLADILLLWGDNGMTRVRKFIGIALLFAVVCIAIAAAVAIHLHHQKPISVWGAVIKLDTDAKKQSPIANAEVSVVGMSPPVAAKSDFSGLFRLRLPPGIRRGMYVTLQFSHPGYDPLRLQEMVSDDLYVIRMSPIQTATQVAQTGRPPVIVSNILVRYSIQTTTLMNIGSEITTFQVQNKGNSPCRRRPPCSPDGKWKAAVGSGTLDAGQGNVFEDLRVSCIAGPCPFTRTLSSEISSNSQKVSVSMLDWSDTTTFLLQADVYRQQINNIVRESYPIIFGQSINFTLPPEAEGPTLEAELNKTDIVFPLGPTLAPILTWADCDVRMARDRSKSYRCELKPGYTVHAH